MVPYGRGDHHTWYPMVEGTTTHGMVGGVGGPLHTPYGRWGGGTTTHTVVVVVMGETTTPTPLPGICTHLLHHTHPITRNLHTPIVGICMDPVPITCELMVSIETTHTPGIQGRQNVVPNCKPRVIRHSHPPTHPLGYTCTYHLPLNQLGPGPGLGLGLGPLNSVIVSTHI